MPPSNKLCNLLLSESAFEGKSEEEVEMMKIMGFGDFDSTKVLSVSKA